MRRVGWLWLLGMVCSGQAMALWMSGREQLVPRDLVYPPDKSKDEVDEANSTDFRQSEDSAEYAALLYLKYPMAVTARKKRMSGRAFMLCSTILKVSRGGAETRRC